jgi:hypothetical protein
LAALAVGGAAVAPVASAHAAASAALSRTCQDVGAVLSDGPDPTVDPVGYALAQVRPLRQIPTTDKYARKAIDRLADAYWAFYKADGKGANVKRAVRKAERHLATFCPGEGL